LLVPQWVKVLRSGSRCSGVGLGAQEWVKVLRRGSRC
jgi:hypothetical protein